MLQSWSVSRTFFALRGATVERCVAGSPLLAGRSGKILAAALPKGILLFQFPPRAQTKRFISLTPSVLSSAPLKTDYYEQLGVSRTATSREIKLAYIRRAKKFHPDANSHDPEAAAKFAAVSEAFEVLSDEEKRGNYDAFGMDGRGTGENEEKTKKKTKKGSGVFGNFVDDDEAQEFHDRVFSQFAADFHEAGIRVDPDVAREYGCSKHGNVPTKTATIELSFTDAVAGCAKKVSLNVVEDCHWCNGFGSPFKSGRKVCGKCEGKGKGTFVNPSSNLPFRGICPRCRGKKFLFSNKCYDCDGKGKILWRKSYAIPVPPGVFDRQTMNVSIGGSEVEMTLLVDDGGRFARDGADVSSDVAISVAQAVLGGTRNVESIYDRVPVDSETPERFKTERATLDIPPGTSSHDVVILEGRGMKKLDEENGYGDHAVNIVISSPSVLTDRQRTLMEEYAESEMGREGTVNVRGGPKKETQREMTN